MNFIRLLWSSFTLFLWQCKAFDAVFFVNVIISVCFSCFFMIQCMLINSNTGVNVTHPSSFFNISGIFALTVSWVIRELKQRRRWRLRKRFVKSEVTYSMAFNLSNVGNFLWRWILKNCIEVQEKKKKVIVLCYWLLVVPWFSRALAFRSLYYSWGKMGDYS